MKKVLYKHIRSQNMNYAHILWVRYLLSSSRNITMTTQKYAPQTRFRNCIPHIYILKCSLIHWLDKFKQLHLLTNIMGSMQSAINY
ncbi:TPA: hypothetical protein GDO54_018409 [Pyxicephalus adspersus]|uniref:Uncharacterized protein n=1 Tax=Pyxicephalus adspersus TaxID=30357 RepID=A0AAV2ZGC0_PYXAD|nr:TPA: hypothetical protein GDO54_018409 [Pyxicephalus adspersus]